MEMADKMPAIVLCSACGRSARNRAPVGGEVLGAAQREGQDHVSRVRGAKINAKCRFEASARSLDLTAIEPLGVAMGDAPGLIVRQLRQPAAIVAHGIVVTRPTRVNP